MIGARALRRALAQAFRKGEARAAPRQAEAVLTAAEQRAAERAAATGHTQPAYRGMREQYRDARAAAQADQGGGQWFSRRPHMASEFGSHEGGNVVPAQLRLGRTLEIDARGADWNRIDARGVPDREVVRRLRRRMRDAIDKSTITTRDLEHVAGELGYESMTIRNMGRGWMKEPDDVFAVLPEGVNKGAIRARWARFDPARAGENDLLAGVAGATAIPAGAASLDAHRRRRRRVANAMEQA